MIRARERERAALQLRKSGATYQQIADALGYRTPDGARRAIMRAMDRLLPVEDAEALRRIEAARLEALTFRLWQRAMDGDLAVIDRLVRISERRCRLLGLDAPARADVTTAGGPFPGPAVYLPAPDGGEGG